MVGESPKDDRINEIKVMKRISGIRFSDITRAEVTRAAVETHYRAMSEERKQQILRRRAIDLAEEPISEEPLTSIVQIIIFTLSGEKYAIESSSVREVRQLRDLTPLPCTPPFVLGIVNIRGQILSVIDIRHLFHVSISAISNMNRLIITRSNHMEMGFLADEILGVHQIAKEAVQEVIPVQSGVRARYLKGFTAERVPILDVAAIMEDERIVVNEKCE